MDPEAANSEKGPSQDEVEEFRSLVTEVAQKADNISSLLVDMNEKIITSDDEVQKDKILTKNGLGFLELKNLVMLEYVSDLSLLLLMKSHGKNIEGAKTIERIVENRTVLEKMKPIEKKLKYQIDKYIKVAENGGKIRPDDPIHFKPNPSALASDDGSSEESDANEDEPTEDS